MKNTRQQRAEQAWRASGTEFDPALCPVRATMAVLSGKWKLLLLSYLTAGPRRYGELRRLVPEITEKMLIQELRALETDGLVRRIVHHEVPPRVEYELVGPGQEVRPVLAALQAWGNAYLQQRGTVGLPEDATLPESADLPAR